MHSNINPPSSISLKRIAELNHLNQRDALSINKIAHMATTEECDRDYFAWDLFVACQKNIIPYELIHPSLALSPDHLYDIDDWPQPDWTFSTSYRNFISSKSGNHYLISKSSLFGWLRHSEYWHALKSNDFIQHWLRENIEDFDREFNDLMGELNISDEERNTPAGLPADRSLVSDPQTSQIPPGLNSFNLRNSMKLIGDFWEIRLNGQKYNLKNSKGIQYIEYLIRNPGKEVHVLELYGAVNPQDINEASGLLSDLPEKQLNEEGLSIGGLNDSYEFLDSEAIAQIKKRIEHLDELIEQAESFGEIEEQEKYEAEKAKIIAHLSTNSGLGGKSRLSDSSAEKARKNVTKQIHSAIKKIQEKFPEFAEHLRAIKTGTYCQYSPVYESTWEINEKN